MEPVHGGRDDLQNTVVPALEKAPQWSPSTEDGTTWSWIGTRCGRWWPQWSPSTEDGTT